MTVNKITAPPTPQGQIDKINEIIDNLGSGSGVSYSATCPAITPTSGVASWNVTHNLGTANIVASLYDSSGALQECNVTVTSANAITVNFKASSNVSAGDYKIVVLASGANADTSNLADKNLSNITNMGTSTGAEWLISSGTYDSLTIGASGTTYTAPATGWFFTHGYFNSGYWGDAFVQLVASNGLGMTGLGTHSQGIYTYIYVPVKKGDTVDLNYYNFNTANGTFRFYYAEGSKWEAS